MIVLLRHLLTLVPRSSLYHVACRTLGLNVETTDIPLKVTTHVRRNVTLNHVIRDCSLIVVGHELTWGFNLTRHDRI